MRGLSKGIVIMLCVVMVLPLSACRKDIYSLSGVDVDAPISMRLSGSAFNFYGETFSSNVGSFTTGDHPEIVVFDGGGFEFNLYRDMLSESGATATLCFNLHYGESIFMEDTLYPLMGDGGSQASVDFLVYGQKRPIDGGGYIREGAVYSYNATDGHIIITDMERYGNGYLLSGEFSFTARSEGGDMLVVEGGMFSDCRVALSYGTSCR